MPLSEDEMDAAIDTMRRTEAIHCIRELRNDLEPETHSLIRGANPALARWLGRLSLLIAFICISIQIWMVQRIVKQVGVAVDAPIVYTKFWHPDRFVYKPGDIINFTVSRANTGDKVLVVGVEGWRDLHSGLGYDFNLTGREVGSGTETAVNRRKVPNDLPPGEYVFQGWMSAQTPTRTLPVSFESEPIKIIDGKTPRGSSKGVRNGDR